MTTFVLVLSSALGADNQEHGPRIYGVGILGNWYTHGAGVCFENKTLLVDASARIVTVNHVPQSFDDFAQGAQAVGSVEQLIAAMEEGIPPSSNAETAVLATETLMAAYQSILEHQTVTLPLASGENPLVAARRK